MKIVKWKILIITSALCLVPILFGLAMWDSLPDSIAIHFDFNGTPDNFTSREFAVFGIPVLMFFAQVLCCVITDYSSRKRGECRKFEIMTKWIIPVLAVALQVAMLGYALGWNIDMRKTATLLVALILVVVGKCMPNLDYVKHFEIPPEKARRVNRFSGRLTVTMGVLAFVTMFLPSIAFIIWMILWIPYTVSTIVYTIRISKK